MWKKWKLGLCFPVIVELNFSKELNLVWNRKWSFFGLLTDFRELKKAAEMVEASLHALVSQELQDDWKKFQHNEVVKENHARTCRWRYAATGSSARGFISLFRFQGVGEELWTPSCALGGGVRSRRRILRSVLRLLLVVFVEEERKHSQDAADSHADGFALQVQHSEISVCG